MAKRLEYYLDDIAVLGDSFIDCSTKVSFVIQLLQEMGFVVNYVKSELVPRQLAVYIGYLIDSIAMRISLPQDKVARISSFANDLFVRKHCSVRVLAQMIGLNVTLNFRLKKLKVTLNFTNSHTKIFNYAVCSRI